MEFVLLELLIYLKLRIMLCDYLNRRVPLIWQLFYLGAVLCLKSMTNEPPFIKEEIINITLFLLPLLFLWYKGSLGGADIKQAWLEGFAHGVWITCTAFVLAILQLGLWHLLKITRYRFQSRTTTSVETFNHKHTTPNPTYPLLPSWIIFTFLLAFSK